MSFVLLLAFAVCLLSLGCAVLILKHAFGMSVGTGFMVLCIPCFIFYYAFSQFEHRFKGAIVAGFIGGWVLTLALELAGGGGIGSLAMRKATF
jgi:translocator protein